MQYPEKFQSLPEYAFPRLRALLDHHRPGGEVLHMSIGEPKHPMPAFLEPILAENIADFAKYPANDGTPALRQAIASWLMRRFNLKAWDAETQVMVLNGTREGLFNACLALSPEDKNGARPAVLLPNPFYQCYAVAAKAAGAEPIFVPATAENGFLPDYHALPEAILRRVTVAYICSPSNPQGAVADRAYLARLLDLAEAYDFRVFADECYSEIYRDAPPPGLLEVAQEQGADPERAIVFHSLSKRSNLPGLRSGFVAGGAGALRAIKRLRAYTGAPVPLPLQAVSAAAWADEAHVVENRRLYAQKFDLADRILGGLPGYLSPQAGFFLWLDVGAGADMALKLWQEHGIRVLPGAYLSRDNDAQLGGGNPGARYIRVALVADLAQVSRGLETIAEHMRKY